MKLTSDSVISIESLVHTAMVGGISSLIIDNNVDGDPIIRGIDEKQSTIILTKNNVPDLNGKKVAISRLSMIASRLTLVKSQGPVEVDAVDAKNGTDISHLELSSGKTKAQFRCNSIESTKGVPKSINDQRVWKITGPSKVISLLNQASGAMNTEKVTISSKDLTSVSFECVDTNNDVFSTEIDNKPEWIGDDGDGATTFAHSYPLKSLLPLLKEANKTTDSFDIFIGAGGSLSLIVNGFDFYILPIA